MDVRVAVLLSGWGTGSTSIAGFLDRAGAWTCPPHQTTADERTPNAYEPAAYSSALRACIDEFTLEPKGTAEEFTAFFKPWLAQEQANAAKAGRELIVLKQPLQTYVLPVLQELADPIYVVVTRPFADIEATRLRRAWHQVYGEAGARLIYGTLYSYLHDNSLAYLSVPYVKFRHDRDLRTGLLAHVGLDPTPDQIADAEGWIR